MTTARYCFHPHEDPRGTQVTKCSLTDLNYDSCCIVTCCCPKSFFCSANSKSTVDPLRCVFFPLAPDIVDVI